MKILREYQTEAVTAVFDELDKGVNRQLLVLATGLGKTFTCSKIIEQFKRTLWITHTEDLIEQSAISIIHEILDKEHVDHILDSDGLIKYMKSQGKGTRLFNADDRDRAIINNVGLIKEDVFHINATLVVASVQTLHRRLDKIPKDHFDLIVVDEAHLSAAATWSKAIDHFDFELLLGMTATPYRADGVSLTNLFEKIIFDRDISFGVKNGFLCELEAYRIKTTQDLSSIKTLGGDFNQAQLSQAIDTPERNRLIVEKYKEYAQDRPFICFAIDVSHAQALSEAFNEGGINTTFVVADEKLCPDRRKRIEDFKSGTYQGLVNVNILTAGFDYPEIACVIMARPTKSLTLYLQSIGRGTRIKKDGGNCIILDIVDVTGKHSLINTWTLDNGKRLEDMIFLSKEQKEILIEKRERNLSKMEKEILHDAKVNLMELPKLIFYDSHSNRQEATPAQLASMARLGYDILEQTWTKGQCTETIGNQRCNQAKIDKLREWGYDVSKGATIGQFSKIEANVARESKYKKMFVENKIKLPFKNLR